MSNKQTTIKKAIDIIGYSMEQGEKCSAKVLSSKAGSGIVFVLSGGVMIPANPESIKIETDYTTSLVKGKYEIRTVEHLLSALWGLGIDNAKIELSGNSVPLLDGSSKSYCKLILAAGTKELSEERNVLKFENPYKYTYSKDSDRYIEFKPSDKLKLVGMIDFPNLIGKQSFSHTWSPSNYYNDISWARTFMNSPLDDDNAVWETVRKRIKMLPEDPAKSPMIVYKENHYITPLKKENEPIRHKLLDFYGDTSLLGKRIVADIYINKPGHEFNREIVLNLQKTFLNG
jgi:UDP-3-O-[3-hydroxymyristoyl] N-acetylglucosamine deacetylase